MNKPKNNYEATEEKIRELVPRLKELSFGQIIEREGERFRIVKFGELGALGQQVYFENLRTGVIDEEPADIILTEYKIIGHKITLEDVLEAIEKHKLDSDDIGYSDWYTEVEKITWGEFKWQYGKDFSLQSEECRNFITEILK